jgi:Holliday junction DNA helicase RuvA
MIDYISGKVSLLTPTSVVIENNGIGYVMEISLQTYQALEGKSEATVFAQSQVNQREGTEVDYGFASRDERETFRLITGISGVGASSARMILSSLSAEELRNAILSEDINLIKSVKGIGLKTAQRMVLELKDKLVKGEGSASETLFVSDRNETVDEATSALQMLGFSKPNINKAVQAVIKKNPSAKVEEIIKAALKML